MGSVHPVGRYRNSSCHPCLWQACGKRHPQWFTSVLVGTVALSFLAELRGFRTEMKADISGLQAEVKEDLKSFRTYVCKCPRVQKALQH